MIESLNENDKVFVVGGRNEWGILRGIYSNCAESPVKLYVIDVKGDEVVYRRSQFLTQDEVIRARNQIGYGPLWEQQ